MAAGVFFDGFSSTAEMLEVCCEAERAGASSLWFAQHMGYREAMVSATAAASVTDRATLVPVASALADRLSALKGVELVTPAFFNEFTLKLSRPAAGVVDALAARGILAGVPASRLGGADDLLIVAATETNTDDDATALVTALKEVL